MGRDHSHGHIHDHVGHTHDAHAGHSHGGHSHGGPNPYDRECQAPTTAAVYCFVTAFLGALSAISLPTHITGYFLPHLPQTTILWATVAFGSTYSILCVICFFSVLEESTSERYRAPVAAEEAGEEGEWEEDEEGGQTRRKMRRLRWISRGATGCVLLEAGLSIALFAMGLKTSAEGWKDWCTTGAVIIVSGSSNSTTAHDAAVSEICGEMHLHQTYLVLAIPGLLLLLELMRSIKVSHFVSLALDRPESVISPFRPLEAADPGAPFDAHGAQTALRSVEVRELASRRRRKAAERLRREYRGQESSDEGEKKLLSY